MNPNADQQRLNLQQNIGLRNTRMNKLGDMYYHGLWVIKNVKNGSKNQFLIVCSHIEIASSIIELFDYERYVSATIFNSGKQRVYASKIAPSFGTDTFLNFVRKNVTLSSLPGNIHITNNIIGARAEEKKNDNENNTNHSFDIDFELNADSMAHGWCVMSFDNLKSAMIVCDTLDNHCEFAYPRLPMKCKQ